MTARATALDEPPRVVVPARRGLNRDEAAAYVGVSVTMFDQLVNEGTMPKPVCIRSRRVWDIRDLDLAFDRMKGQDAVSANSWADI